MERESVRLRLIFFFGSKGYTAAVNLWLGVRNDGLVPKSYPKGDG